MFWWNDDDDINDDLHVVPVQNKRCECQVPDLSWMIDYIWSNIFLIREDSLSCTWREHGISQTFTKRMNNKWFNLLPSPKNTSHNVSLNRCSTNVLTAVLKRSDIGKECQRIICHHRLTETHTHNDRINWIIVYFHPLFSHFLMVHNRTIRSYTIRSYTHKNNFYNMQNLIFNITSLG